MKKRSVYLYNDLNRTKICGSNLLNFKSSESWLIDLIYLQQKKEDKNVNQ